MAQGNAEEKISTTSLSSHVGCWQLRDEALHAAVPQQSHLLQSADSHKRLSNQSPAALDTKMLLPIRGAQIGPEVWDDK